MSLYRCDPALWIIDDYTKDYLSINGFPQDLKCINVSNSKRAYKKSYRGVIKTYYRYYLYEL